MAKLTDFKIGDMVKRKHWKCYYTVDENFKELLNIDDVFVDDWEKKPEVKKIVFYKNVYKVEHAYKHECDYYLGTSDFDGELEAMSCLEKEGYVKTIKIEFEVEE